mgnify:CR=1 FL=1
MRVREQITDNLLPVVRKLTKKDIDVQVSISERLENGDYFTNVALRLGPVLKKKPLDVAYEIKRELESLKFSEIEKVEVAPPGFINFFLSRRYLISAMSRIREKGSKFGNSDVLKNQKVMFEFTDPNPFKEFHIGHLYSNIIGESLSRLFESQGAHVLRACYQGDVGLHVAKAIYGMQKLKKELPDENAPLSIRAQFMGRAYSLGSRDYESNESIKTEINELNKKIYSIYSSSGSDPSLKRIYEKGRAWSLEYFESIYERLGTKFERYYFESEVGKAGLKLVREFLKKGVFEESDGAIIFPGEKYARLDPTDKSRQGLHNRVFINSLNLPTYEAKDLGLAAAKFADFPYDKSIILTGQEQVDYFKVVLRALMEINPDLALKTTHITHGMVRLSSGKMSSRTGDVITGEWLMDEAVSRISKAYPDMDGPTAQKVGLAAIKYALLKGSIGSDMEFSFDESISLTGASGPYLQYAYVRTKSVIEKNHKARIMRQEINAEKGLNPEELAVLRSLEHFEEIVSEAKVRLAPNLIAEYLFDLAQKFNLFYQKHKIAGNSFRLELTSAVGQGLKNGLALLGIETVKHM